MLSFAFRDSVPQVVRGGISHPAPARIFAFLILLLIVPFIATAQPATSRQPSLLDRLVPAVAGHDTAAASIPPVAAPVDSALSDTAAGGHKSGQGLSGKAVLEEAPKVEWSLSLSRIFWATVVFLIGFFIIRSVTRLLEFIAERRARSRQSIKAAVPVIRIFGWTFILYFIIAKVFAPPIETVLALTASLGIAVGFAAQDILKNIFGGLMILFDRPFSVGDKIKVGEHYGEVVSIGLRTVRIVTPDDSIVSVPNAEMAAQSVSNANSGASDCQVVAEFYLPPNVDLEAVQRIAIRAAQISRYTYLNKPVSVTMRNEIQEGRSLVKVRLKAYVFDIRYEFPHITDMTRIVLDELISRKLVRPEDMAMLEG